MLNVCWGRNFIVAGAKSNPGSSSQRKSRHPRHSPARFPAWPQPWNEASLDSLAHEFGIAELKGKINLLTENAPAIADSEIGTVPSNSERHPFYDAPLKKMNGRPATIGPFICQPPDAGNVPDKSKWLGVEDACDFGRKPVLMAGDSNPQPSTLVSKFHLRGHD